MDLKQNDDNVSFINTWAYINKTYSKNNKGAILRKCFALKKDQIKHNFKCWLFAALHVGVGIIAILNGSNHFFYGLLAIGLVTIIALYFTDKKLSKDLPDIYKKYRIKDYGPFSRGRPLSYALFKERLDKDKVINATKIKLLIKWSHINSDKVDRSTFFKSQYFLIVITALLTLITQQLIGLKPTGKDIILIIYFTFVVLVSFWFIFDLSLWKKDRELNIIRFLKWYEIDNEIKNT